jgi:hypothetical protein
MPRVQSVGLHENLSRTDFKRECVEKRKIWRRRRGGSGATRTIIIKQRCGTQIIVVFDF